MSPGSFSAELSYWEPLRCQATIEPVSGELARGEMTTSWVTEKGRETVCCPWPSSYPGTGAGVRLRRAPNTPTFCFQSFVSRFSPDASLWTQQLMLSQPTWATDWAFEEDFSEKRERGRGRERGFSGERGV